MKRTKINFKSDGNYIFEDIQGNIKKICIKSSTPLNMCNLVFYTSEGEILYKTNIEQPIMVLYPSNFIDVQGRHMDYYSYGPITLVVEGLTEGQEILEISIFYE